MKQSTIDQYNDQFTQEDWAGAYCNVEEELSNVTLKVIEGSIPKEINGTFYRNGPGRLERSGQWVHHPFDGDGMIASIKFKNGQSTFNNRYVRTQAWEEEEKAGKFIYRGVFGTQKPGGIFANAFDVRLKNIANTHVVKLGDKLLALWEASSPHALDPSNLSTIGLSNLNGILHKSEAFSAHPHFDPGHHAKKRMMVTFGVQTGPKSTIRLMEFATEGCNAGEIINDRKDTFKGFAFLHDFAITPNWAIFLQNAVSFNPLPFVFGYKGAGQCLSSKRESQGKFWLIPRDSGKYKGSEPKIINAPSGFVFHHLNAYEKENNIILDSIFYEDFPSIGPNEDFKQINFKELPEGILKRVHINLSNNSIESKILSNQCCEFAMVNPLKVGLDAEYCWMATAAQKKGNGPLQSIKKLNLISGEEIFWSAAPRGFVSEPIFIPKQNSRQEDIGWVIDLIWNSETNSTELVILNSKDLQQKARVKIPIKIPHGLHGSWVENHE